MARDPPQLGAGGQGQSVRTGRRPPRSGALAAGVKLPTRAETRWISLVVVRGTAGAWSVAVRSAWAHRAAVFGELLVSAARALLIWASSGWSQNSDQLGLPVESGTNARQA